MTLTELAVVIGISGTLMAIAIPNYQQMMEKERIKSQQTDIMLNIRQAQTDCIFQKRTAQISISDTSVTSVTIPSFQEVTPTYTPLSAGSPALPAPLPIPGTTAADEVPVTRTQGLRFPAGYKAIYVNVRGMLYTLDENSEPVYDPTPICFKTAAVVVGPIQIRLGRKEESTPCTVENITCQ